MTEKLDTEFQLRNLFIDFPTTVNFQHLYLEDLSGDTLLHFDNLKVDINLFALLNKRVKISNVRLYQAEANLIKSESDSTFNFQFIIDRLGGQSSENKESQSDWEVVIGGTYLNKVKFQYLDPHQNTHLQTNIGELDIDLNKVDLKDLSFDVEDIILENSSVTFLSKPIPSDTLVSYSDATLSTDLKIQLENITITNTQVYLNDTYSNTSVKAGEIELEEGSFSLKDQLVNCENVRLLNSSVSYEILRSDSIYQKPENTQSNAKPWTANIKSISLENNTLGYDNKLMPHQSEGFDANHIKVSSLNGNLEDIHYKGGNIAANCNNLSLFEQSGIELKKLQSALNISKENISINNLQLHVNQTQVTGSTSFYPKYFFNDSINSHTSYIDIKGAIIHTEDILNAIPSLKNRLPDSLTLNLKASISGQLASLSIDHFTGSLDSMELKLSGTFEGLPDINRTRFNVPDLQLTASNKTLKNLLPDTLWPQNIAVPDSMALRAKLNGHWYQGNNKIEMATSFGNVNLELQHFLDTATNNLQLDGQTDIQNFQLGQLLKNNNLGKVDGKLAFNNRSGSPDSTKINVKGNIDTFEYNQYAYRGLEINGQFRKTSFDGNINMKSEALDFNYNGKAVFNDTTIRGIFTLDLNYADLKTLKLAQSPYTLKGRLNTNFNLDTLGHFNGNVAFSNINILKNDVFYKVDSIKLTAESNKSKTNIKLQSDLLSANVSGNIDLIDIPAKIKAHINQYANKDTIEVQPDTSQNKQLEFSLEFHDKALLTNVLIPDLNEVKITDFKGHYDEAKNELYFKFVAPKISYGDNELDSLSLEIRSSAASLQSDLNWSRLSNNIMSLKDFTLLANTQDDTIDVSINIPKGDIDLIRLGGKLYQSNGIYYFSFYPDQIVFNGKQWHIPEDNFIGFSPGLPTKNITISRNDHELSFNTNIQKGDTSLNVGFRNFNLSNFGNALSIRDTLIGGILNGNFQMITSAAGLALNSNINIDQLTYHKQHIGQFSLKSSYKNLENIFTLDIEGPDNQVRTKGNFKTGDQLEYEITSNIDKLNIHLLQPALRDNVDSLSGTLSGQVNIKSRDTGIPGVDGLIKMNKIYVLPTYLNTSFHIENEEIRFKDENISFETFTITDENNNSAELTGNVIMDNYSTFKYQLSAKTRNFKLFNTTRENHDLYYGTMFVDSDIDITGNEYQYDINANVSIRENSNFTFVVPETETSVASYEDVVKFVDRDAKQNAFLQRLKEKQSSDTSDVIIEGMDLQANVNVNEKSKLSIIIDQNTGDRLDLQGNADLSLSMPPAGDMRLSGRYEIVDGKYKLNFYQLARREFQIVKGSSVIWTGDPMEANLDITTRYVAETTPPVSTNQSKMPFYVNLYIGGKILSPELSFELSMPEDLREAHPNIYSVLQDYNSEESMQAQQVFGLIVFNSFMSRDSDQSPINTTSIVSGAARSSLSKILTQQLNKLAGNINAVDLDFNLESYNTGADSQARTNLELGLSKSLFNDRLIVRVAGNVNINDSQEQQDLSDYAGDILIEYKISKSGELRLQGFRTDEYDALSSQGEVINTGAGLIFVKDYNTLEELFKGNKKESGK